mmetsp:Transcript_19702/g.55397  ORF Transcript_19702/g.55397 Transcript_19702/m.55397 type:complete len:133 (+) Transcript_19702:94-492(+)
MGNIVTRNYVEKAGIKPGALVTKATLDSLFDKYCKEEDGRMHEDEARQFLKDFAEAAECAALTDEHINELLAIWANATPGGEANLSRENFIYLFYNISNKEAHPAGLELSESVIDEFALSIHQSVVLGEAKD